MDSQVAKFQDNTGMGLHVEFDVVKVTKPLASVHSIAKMDNRVVFEEKGGYIQNVQSNTATALRLDGQLYYLDVWIQVPEDLVIASPLTKQQGR